jgi:hypothetical protein
MKPALGLTLRGPKSNPLTETRGLCRGEQERKATRRGWSPPPPKKGSVADGAASSDSDPSRADRFLEVGDRRARAVEEGGPDPDVPVDAGITVPPRVTLNGFVWDLELVWSLELDPRGWSGNG